jgi:hypothetical protein
MILVYDAAGDLLRSATQVGSSKSRSPLVTDSATCGHAPFDFAQGSTVNKPAGRLDRAAGDVKVGCLKNAKWLLFNPTRARNSPSRKSTNN